MKKILIILSVALCVLGCKTQEWADWKTQNDIWLLQNAQNEDVQISPTGLQYKIIHAGNPTDVRPQSTSTVNVDYTLHLVNGKMVDHGTQTNMGMSSVIAGFAEGLKYIHVGGDIILYVPWQLGYLDGDDSTAQGTEGTSSYLPPYSTLIFTIHLNGCAN